MKRQIVQKRLIKMLLAMICIITMVSTTNSIYANDEDDEDIENLVNNEIVREIENEVAGDASSELTNGNMLNSNEISNNVATGSNEASNNLATGSNVSNGTLKVKKPKLNSRRYVVFDRKSRTAVYGKDEYRQTAMASTTKIMTCLVVLENCKNLSEVITIDEKTAGTGGSVLGLKKDDKITVSDLLYGLMLRSGNDCAVALAKHIGGSKEGFANMMNDKAKEIGLKNTHFVTPHGLDDPNHYTTAYELACLTDYALKNDDFGKIVKTAYKTIAINGSSREIKNTNELLLANVEGVYGVKTGFTNNAGRCLVTAVKRNDMDLIIVVLGADTRKDRAKDTLKLIDYAYKQFIVKDVESVVREEFEKWNQINVGRIYINKGRKSLELELGEIAIKQIVTDKDLKVEINALNYLEAPLARGQKIGTLIVKNGEDIIDEVDINVKKDVSRRGILDYFHIIGKLYFSNV